MYPVPNLCFTKVEKCTWSKIYKIYILNSQKNGEKSAKFGSFFITKKSRKMLKKKEHYDINIKRKTIDKLNQKMEDKNVKK